MVYIAYQKIELLRRPNLTHFFSGFFFPFFLSLTPLDLHVSLCFGVPYFAIYQKPFYCISRLTSKVINRIKFPSLFNHAWIQYRKGIPLFENLGHFIGKRFPCGEKFTFTIFFVFSFSVFPYDVPLSVLLRCVCLMTRGGEVIYSM